MTEREMIYMAIGFAGGVIFVSMFWFGYVEDLKKKIAWLEQKVRALL